LHRVADVLNPLLLVFGWVFAILLAPLAKAWGQSTEQMAEASLVG